MQQELVLTSTTVDVAPSGFRQVLRIRHDRRLASSPFQPWCREAPTVAGLLVLRLNRSDEWALAPYREGERPSPHRKGVDQVTGHSAFWDDLTRDLGDPEFEREYVAESIFIADFDAAINACDKRPINPSPEHGA